MGCFNVSCGITRLSIGLGDKCVLLPLAASLSSRTRLRTNIRKFSGDKLINTICPPNVLITYTHDIWEPMTLPIHGEYNEYGSIENIVHDENTAIIEAEYGMKIEDFVRILCDLRKDPYDKYSEFSEFFKYPKDLDSYDCKMDVFMEHLGFSKEEDGSYKDDNCIVRTGNIENGYRDGFCATFKGDDNSYNYQSYDRRRFLNDYHENTNVWLGIEEPEKMVELLSASGMFILEGVYDFYAKNHLNKNDNIVKKFPLSYAALIQSGFVPKYDCDDDCDGILEKDGHTLNFEEKLFDGEKVYDMDDFLKAYKKITKQSFDVSRWNGMDAEDWYRMEFEGYGINQVMHSINRFAKKLGEPINIEKENVGTLYFSTSGISPFEFMEKFMVMKRIYTKPIMMKKCLDAFYEFRRLMFAMNLTNVLLMPGTCGTQCGCDEAEGKLVYIMKQIVNERYERQKEDGDEPRKITSKNAFNGFNDRYY